MQGNNIRIVLEYCILEVYKNISDWLAKYVTIVYNLRKVDLCQTNGEMINVSRIL